MMNLMVNNMDANSNISNMDWGAKPKTGDSRRIEMLSNTFNDSVVFPKTLEYEDIDREFIKFVKEKINILDDSGKIIPAFELFSNQRFTEFSQTFKHTDEDGNLLMNFMTIVRANNPILGENQGRYANIPGNRKYTIGIKEVLEDNGNESYEVYSMEEPVSINMQYKLSLITSKYKKLNEMNMIMNHLFQSIQYYLCPNGYYIPMKLENINDETQYTIEDRKFFIQSYDLKVLAYIITKDSFEIKKFPKRKLASFGLETNVKPSVGVLEKSDGSIDKITVNFNFIQNKCEFEMDEDTNIKSFDVDNIRYAMIKVNGNKVFDIMPNKYIEDEKDDKTKFELNLKNKDIISIKIKRVNEKNKSSIIFNTKNN